MRRENTPKSGYSPRKSQAGGELGRLTVPNQFMKNVLQSFDKKYMMITLLENYICSSKLQSCDWLICRGNSQHQERALARKFLQELKQLRGSAEVYYHAF